MSAPKPERPTLEERAVGLFLALVVGAPTLALIWLYLNIELSSSPAYLSTRYFWVSSALLAVVGFAAPRFFIELLGRIWRWMHRFID